MKIKKYTIFRIFILMFTTQLMGLPECLWKYYEATDPVLEKYKTKTIKDSCLLPSPPYSDRDHICFASPLIPIMVPEA